MGARRGAALLLVTALAFGGLAACGGDDDDGDDAVELEDAGSAGSADDGGSDDEDATGDVEDLDDVAGLFGEGCGDFVAVYSALGGAIAGAFDEDAAEELAGFVADAPEAIRDDLEVVTSAYRDYADALADAGFDPDDPSSFDPSDADAIEAFTEAAESLDTEEFQEATAAIDEFVGDNCGAG